MLIHLSVVSWWAENLLFDILMLIILKCKASLQQVQIGMIFFVWLGKCSYLERIFADEELWHSTMLPGLVAFYDTHARPYLLRKNRPVAPMKAEEKAGNQPGVCSQAASETLLPAEQCQSIIDGRSGSSACAIIAGLFSHYFLFADERPCLTPSALCKVMADGNAVYDSHEFFIIILLS